MSPPRLFSLDEANSLLPQLEAILHQLLQKKAAHDRRHDELFLSELLHEATKRGPAGADFGAREVDGGVLDLEEDLDKIRTLGCILRNLEMGCVEFPGVRQGEKIYFCWKRGEAAIQYYRPLKSAPHERLPLYA